jgi:hypothetical protein
MKNIAFIVGIAFVGIIGLLEILASHKREKNNIQHNRLEHEDVWWGN